MAEPVDVFADGYKAPAPAGGPVDVFADDYKAPEPSGIIRRAVGDTAVSLGKGVIGAGEAAVGLADLVSGGHAGKALADTAGYDPKRAKAMLEEYYSPEQRAANAELARAKGFLPTIAAAVQNPSTIVQSAAESAPLMLGGGAIARGARALAPGVAPVVAGAAGEGAITAGSQAEQIRQETPDGTLTAQQALLAGLSGAATGALTLGAGRVAQKLGISDIDIALAGGGMAGQNKGLIRRMAEGALSEGVLEEAPQSAQEQIIQNVALGRPWQEGVGEATAMGMLTGGLIGGGVNVAHGPIAEAAGAGGTPPPGPADAGPKLLMAPGAPGAPASDIGPDAGVRDLEKAHSMQNAVDRAAAQDAAREAEAQRLAAFHGPLSTAAATAVSGGAAEAAGAQREADLREKLSPATPLALPAPVDEQEKMAQQKVNEYLADKRPTTLTAAQRTSFEGEARGFNLIVVPHPSGKGYTTIPDDQLSPRQKQAVESIQRPDQGQLPSPHMEMPGQWVAPEGRTPEPRMYGQNNAGMRAAMDEWRSTFGVPVPRQAPIKDEARASQIAERRTQETGREHVVVPHPMSSTGFAVAPAPTTIDGEATRVQDQPASTQNGQMPGVGDGATPAVQPTAQPTGQAAQVAPEGVWRARFPGENAPWEKHAGEMVGDRWLPRADAAIARAALERGAADVPNQPQAPTSGGGLQLAQQIEAAVGEAATSPTNDLAHPSAAQASAGNYRKGHVKLHGLDISIENPAGSVRVAKDGSWASAMPNHYGYIRRTEGADGDHVDTFVGPNPESTQAFIVDQIDPKTGKFDEHKVMLGFDTAEAAEAGYRAAYPKDWQGMRAITPATVDELKQWIKSGDTKTEFAKSGKGPTSHDSRYQGNVDHAAGAEPLPTDRSRGSRGTRLALRILRAPTMEARDKGIEELPSLAKEIVAAAVNDVRDLGMPEVAFDGLSAIGMHNKQNGGEGAYVWSPQAISLHRRLLEDIARGDEMAARTLRGVIAHETWHHLDNGDVYFSSARSPLLEIAQSSGVFVPFGEIAVEAWEEFGNPGSPLQLFLNYPLGAANKIPAGLSARQHAEILQNEVFAQLGRLFYTNPKLMRERLPKAHRLFQEIHRGVQSASNIGEARAAVRAALLGQATVSRGADRGPDRNAREGAEDGQADHRRDGAQHVHVARSAAPEGNRANGRGQRDARVPEAPRAGERTGQAPRQAERLTGAPETAYGPSAVAQRVARDYMRDAGLKYAPPTTYAKVDPARGKRIAEAYAAMPHAPQDPRVKASYAAMIKETLAQWRAIEKTGLKVTFADDAHPYPYKIPQEVFTDVAENNHMWVFPTDAGFGSDANFDPSENPLLAKTDVVIGGKTLLANDVFRIVHDYFGHIKNGVGFRANGEENAWRAHAAMYSPLARLAMTSETRGQNSWVNWGPNGETNRKASQEDTTYADQKTGLLPIEFTVDNYEKPDALEAREDQTNAPAFKKWFGDSKVVDANGKPLRVYHGTGRSFDRFSPAFAQGGPMWFTKNTSYASGYAENADGDPVVYPVFLTIKNPVDLSVLNINAPLDVDKLADVSGLDYGKLSHIEQAYFGDFDGKPKMYELVNSEDFVRLARAAGHDGVVAKEGRAGQTWGAFDSEQIKSAVGNNGDFDPNKPSMLEAREGDTDSRGLREVGRAKGAPGSDVGHKREASSGRYVGAPDWVGGSPGKLAHMRKRLHQLALEGEVGRYWYEKSSRSILEFVGGNKADAEKFVALIAIYSPNNAVPGNTTAALLAWYQHKAGMPIRVAMKTADNKANDLMYRGKMWSGVKTNSFYQNLMVEIDPSKLDDGVATMDMWMALAFDYGDKAVDQGPKYRFMETEIQRLGKDLDWAPHQVQAAVWTAMKGRIDPIRGELKARELKVGIGEMYEDDGKQKYRVKKGREYDHFRLAHRMGMGWRPDAEHFKAASYDFADALRGRSAQLSWEARPSADVAKFPELFSAPIEQQIEYMAAMDSAMRDDNGRDLIAAELGILAAPTRVGPAAWLGEVGAGGQVQAAVAQEAGKGGAKRTVEALARDALDAWAAVRGLALKQDGVYWHFPVFEAAKRDHNGLQITFPRDLSVDDTKALYNAIIEKAGHNSWAPAVDGNVVRILNFDGDNSAFRKTITQALETLPFDVDLVGFRADASAVENNWKEQPNGEGYRQRLIAAGRSSLLRWAETTLADAVERVDQAFAERYGWTREAGTQEARREEVGKPDSLDVREPGDIGKQIKAALGSNRAYAILNESGRDAGPFDGGCLICADAIQMAYGGSLVRLTSKEAGAEHYGVRIGDRVYDAAGAHDSSQSWASTFAKREMLSKRELSFAEGLGNNGEIPRDVNASQRIAALFRPAPPKPDTLEARENSWVVIDDAIPSLQAAENIIRMRTKGNSVVRPMAMWQGVEFRVVQSEFHGDGWLQIEARRPAAKSDAPDARENQTDTPAFKKWFGDSKVVDDAGAPLRVYHGTQDAGFEALDSPTGEIYFTDSANTAYSFSGDDTEATIGQEGPGLIHAFLRISNPLVVDFKGNHWDGLVDGAGYGGEPERYVKLTLDGAIARAKKAGRDGVIAHNIVSQGPEGGRFDGADPATVYVVFDPKQVKSATQNSGAFNPNKPSILETRETEPQPLWYSGLSAALDKAPWAKDSTAGAGQLRAWLAARTKDGLVKAEELKWSGLEEYLAAQPGKVSRADVEAFLDQNGVRVEEVELNDRGRHAAALTIEDVNELNELLSRPGASMSVADRARMNELISRANDDASSEGGGAKFGSYQLPGGKNYRELLLTLPPTKVDLPQWKIIRPDGHVDSTFATEESARIQAERRGPGYRVEQGPPKQIDSGFRSSHFDQPNILAHVRFNERTDAEGRRVLFLEEIQSDWAQKGRREGFGPKYSAGHVDQETGAPLPGARPVSGMGVPRAPFVGKTEQWLTLAMKRMIRYASDHGFESISWTTGDQQADRYDLSKQVKEIEAWKDGPETYSVQAQTHNGAFALDEKKLSKSALADAVGKDIAEKIVAQATKDHDSVRLSGLDLKVGGEGMRAFYDRIVPNAANDLLKKLGGGRVGEMPIQFKTIAKIGSRWGILEDDGDISNRTTSIAKLRKLASLPQPGFTITPEMRPIAQKPQALFSAGLSFDAVTEGVQDLLTTSRSFNLWDRTVGTQLNKALKHADFKKVYDGVQRYLNDASKMMSEAADRAPDLLPKLDGLGDILKRGPSKADLEKVSSAIFDGTIADTVYTDAELAQRGLDAKQIGLYRQARAAIDHSLADAVTSEAVKEARGLLPQSVLDQAKAAGDPWIVVNALSAIAQRTPAQQQVYDHLRQRAAQMSDLQRDGYAPLQRFGQYTVHVADANGDSALFTMHESEREANAFARAARAALQPGQRLTQGIMSKEAWKTFQGISPDTLQIFAESLGASQSEVMQKYIKLAVNNRSVLKRMLQRKEIAGFQTDIQRTLAQFVTSNARAASRNYHWGDILRAEVDIAKEQGDVKDEAVKLRTYVQDSREEAGALRGLLFIQFLGGSIASAVTNATQPVMMTFPWLSQHVGPAKAAAQLVRAGKVAGGGNAVAEPGLRVALERATKEGVVSPHEVAGLYAESIRNFGSNLAVRRALKLWGSLFSVAEQFNRRITFVAAYRAATDAGMADPYAFAEKAIAETQGVYNRGNRPDWARGPVGATLMTFKQYSIAYVELLARLPKREKAIMLAVLILASGLQGLPGADDIEDVIDTIAESLGYSFNSKRQLREWAARQLGDTFGPLLTHGVSALPGVPLDVQARLGLGNLVPGTCALKRSSTDKGRDVLEFFGPAGSQAKSMMDAFSAAQEGDAGAVAKSMVPLAVQNALKGLDMAQSGFYKDTRGRRVIDTDAYDAAIKAVGFQPARVAKQSRVMQDLYQDIALNRDVESQLVGRMARAIVEKSSDDLQAARVALHEWNVKNPSSPIMITPQQVRRRASQMMVARDQRFAASAPKEMRGAVTEALRQ